MSMTYPSLPSFLQPQPQFNTHGAQSSGGSAAQNQNQSGASQGNAPSQSQSQGLLGGGSGGGNGGFASHAHSHSNNGFMGGTSPTNTHAQAQHYGPAALLNGHLQSNHYSHSHHSHPHTYPHTLPHPLAHAHAHTQSHSNSQSHSHLAVSTSPSSSSVDPVTPPDLALGAPAVKDERRVSNANGNGNANANASHNAADNAGGGDANGADDNIECKWADCDHVSPSPDELYDHLCNYHVGRKSTGNLNLTCSWEGCGVKCVKRDHITSHLRGEFSLSSRVSVHCRGNLFVSLSIAFVATPTYDVRIDRRDSFRCSTNHPPSFPLLGAKTHIVLAPSLFSKLFFQASFLSAAWRA